MRNGVSLLKHYLQRPGVSRSRRAIWRGSGRFCSAASALALAFSLTVAWAAEAPPPELPGRPAPGLARLFLPRHAPAGSYQLTVLDGSIEPARDQVLAALAPGAKPGSQSDAWSVTRTDPLEAYGDGGIYERSRLARLYAGRPALVVRGPITRDGRVVASVTLISPYPDATLTRLTPGTLAILFLPDLAKGAR